MEACSWSWRLYRNNGAIRASAVVDPTNRLEGTREIQMRGSTMWNTICRREHDWSKAWERGRVEASYRPMKGLRAVHKQAASLPHWIERRSLNALSGILNGWCSSPYLPRYCETYRNPKLENQVCGTWSLNFKFTKCFNTLVHPHIQVFYM